MIVRSANEPVSRPLKAELNRSSRTTTSWDKRKKPKPKSSVGQTEFKIAKLIKADQLLLPKLFDDAAIEEALAEVAPEQPSRKRVYTVPITLSLFVQQVLMKDRGCKGTVTLFNQKRMQQRETEVSGNTTSYCEARARIPLPLIERLTADTARIATESLKTKHLWRGHRVLLVDGVVVNAPDTPENQYAYPQTKSQQPGLGFPHIRLCAAVCLATGVVTDWQYGPVVGKKTGETTLFRKMFPGFRQGDVIVADSLFDAYRDHAMLQAKGVHTICDKHGTRVSPFTGPCTKLEETWEVLSRPKFYKHRSTREEWEALPEELPVRIIRCHVGGRKGDLTLVTTLLDKEAYPADAIVSLYKKRWDVEGDIRSMKSVMGMSSLSCHTPDMLARELMVYILAYNIIRITMCDAAELGGYQPRDLSFKGARDAWLAFGRHEPNTWSYGHLLWSIADVPLRKRPGRREPRKIKQRESKYPKMTMPRDQEKAELFT